MKVAPLAVLLLSVCAFGQQTTTPNEKGGIVHTGDDGQPSGTIHGTVVDQSGRPAKSLRVGVIWMCPTGCSIQMSSTITGETGEFNLGPLHLGKWGIFADDAEAGYSLYATGFASPVAELSIEHPDAQLPVVLPPKAGRLVVQLKDRATGAIIPNGEVGLASANNSPEKRWRYGVVIKQGLCDLVTTHSCEIVIPPNQDIVVHVFSEKYNEWSESAGTGKPLRVASGEQVSWNVELEPLKP